MKLKKQYAIRFEGEQKFWVEISRGGWNPSPEFTAGCLMTNQQAKAWVKHPPGVQHLGIDKRFKKYEIKMDAFRVA